MKTLIVILIIIGAFFGWQFIDTHSGTIISVPDSSGLVWKFKKGKAISLNGRVLPYPATITGSVSAVKGSLDFCTEDAYRILQEEYIKKNKCCKPFWGKYSKKFFLLTDDRRVAQKMNYFEFGNKVELEGIKLRFLGIFDQKGKKIQSAWSWSGFTFLYVNDLKVYTPGRRK